MPYEEFVVYLEEKCGGYFQGLYYQVPSQELERGLVRVSDDRSLSYMFDVEETFGRLNFYLYHLDIDLSEYLSQAITYDMDACVSKTIGPPKKRYCNDFSLDKMVDWAEMEVEKPKGVETRTSTIEVDATDCVEARTSTTKVDATDGVDATDKGKEKVSQYATEVVQTRISTVKIDSEAEYDSDDVSDYQSDKSVDYLSPGEKELIELRIRMKANREAKTKAKDNPVSELNKPNDENSMPTDNVRDPFIFVEKHVERYPMYDETTHRRLRKPKVGEKYVSVTQFKECLTYYALANGFSLWYERSREARVVAKCGQRKHVSSAGTQKRQGKKKVETSGFAKWFGLQDEPEQTQDEPQQTQHEPEQVQLQEQPQQAALRMPSARILQRKLGKEGSKLIVISSSDEEIMVMGVLDSDDDVDDDDDDDDDLESDNDSDTSSAEEPRLALTLTSSTSTR
ncbi:hypothetical protein Tco_0277711 [Tanacetum coccineum]